MRYEHARALYFLARALLEQRQGRRRASDALSSARALARELGAAPLLNLTEQLAAQAHLHIVDAAPSGAGTPPEGRTLAGARLTRREGEIRTHLVAGETYAQIAARLYISEKTVSVHASNMLHKTGTTSRIELSALARQSDGHTGDGSDT
jgi:DNA-binding NarL/FixJ family response regulator